MASVRTAFFYMAASDVNSLRSLPDVKDFANMKTTSSPFIRIAASLKLPAPWDHLVR